jgi:hypothetical protein
MSGLVLAGTFVLVSAAMYVATRGYGWIAGPGAGDVNRRIARDMVWFDTDALRRIRAALVRPNEDFLPCRELVALSAFASASSVMSAFLAVLLWFKAGSMSRRCVRGLNWAVWGVLACVSALDT